MSFELSEVEKHGKVMHTLGMEKALINVYEHANQIGDKDLWNWTERELEKVKQQYQELINEEHPISQ